MNERFLLIDTCGAVGRVALAESGSVLAEAEMPGRTYSERLVSEGGRLLREAGWRLGELAAIGVVHGPGSFTGVRVGVSAAKGWSEAAGVPVIALSRLNLLELLEAEVSGTYVSEGEGHVVPASKLAGDPGDGAPGLADSSGVVAVLDAGRGEFYVRSGGEERLMVLAEVEALGAGRVVVCEAAVAEALGAISPQRASSLGTPISPQRASPLGTSMQPVLVAEPGVAGMLRLVRERFAAGRFDDVAVLDANYVRRSDAEIFAKPLVSAKSVGAAKPTGDS